jgi:signal transduction histidine kinase
MARLIDALFVPFAHHPEQDTPAAGSTSPPLAREIGDELLQEDACGACSSASRPGMTAAADASLLRAVFDNLLRNAWKFTAQAELRVDRGRQRAGARPVRLFRPGQPASVRHELRR